MMKPLIKDFQERPDEAELAVKMVETTVTAARPAPGAMGAAPPGPGAQRDIKDQGADQRLPPDPLKTTSSLDEASSKGHFGWETVGQCHIPYIYRSGRKYVSVRMVEIELLYKYLNCLHTDIYSCACIESYYITQIEAQLLNEINKSQCDSQFGHKPFTQKDLLVRLSDVLEFYNFLDICFNKLLHGTRNTEVKCGFIAINKESVVPYTVRDRQKFVPLFYFDCEMDNVKLKAHQLKGWDLLFLKFCCKVHGIENELFAGETCDVISLTDLKSYFPVGTEFEEYWPNRVVDLEFLNSAKGSVSGSGQWTRAPLAPPPVVVGSASASTGVGSNSVIEARTDIKQHKAVPGVMQTPYVAGPSAAAVQALAIRDLFGQLAQGASQQVKSQRKLSKCVKTHRRCATTRRDSLAPADTQMPHAAGQVAATNGDEPAQAQTQQVKTQMDVSNPRCSVIPAEIEAVLANDLDSDVEQGDSDGDLIEEVEKDRISSLAAEVELLICSIGLCMCCRRTEPWCPYRLHPIALWPATMMKKNSRWPALRFRVAPAPVLLASALRILVSPMC